MNDMRRSILFVVFAFSLIMLWDKWQIHQGKPATFFPAPPAAEQSAAGPATASPASSTAAPAVVGSTLTPPVANAATTAAAPAPVAQGEILTVTTESMKLGFSTLGGDVVRAELLQHVDLGQAAGSSNKLVLLDQSANRIYRAQSGLLLTNPQGGGQFPAQPLVMTPSQSQENGQTVLRFTGIDAQGAQLTKIYTIPATGYLLSVRHEVENKGTAALSPKVFLQLERDGNKPVGDSYFYSTFTGPAFYTDEKKYQKVEFKHIEAGDADFVKTSNHGFVALAQHYFATAWLPDDVTKKESVPRENYVRKVAPNLYAAGLATALPVLQPGQTAALNTRLFIGPQAEKTLESIYPGLEAVKDYGIFTIFAKPLFKLMHFLHSGAAWSQGFFKGLQNWGWTIIALVVLLKIALYWLNAKAYASMAKMKAVTPRITELRERLKDNPQQMQMEMMKIYREEKVNPVGGCLPMLVQIPIFIALYWVILSSVEFRGAPWVGWIKDLSAPDPFYILPLLMTATSLLQVWLNPTPPDPMQAKMMWAMPLIFSVMFFFFPSGLVLYWLTNNILSIAQQWIINKRLGVN